MTRARHIAFYAPMKSPHHPVPSGDREMAKLFVAALTMADYDVAVASEFKAYDKLGEAVLQRKLQAEGEAVAAQLLAAYQNGTAAMPELWFTYHLYHKAPDWLGPTIARALNIPYVVAEASHAPKQATGNWALNYRAAEQAFRQADRILCMTRLDLACVEALRPAAQVAQYFPPYLDVAPPLDRELARRDVAARYDLDPAKTWLLCVAMMRRRDKLPSYTVLAAALAKLSHRNWQFLVVGDGEEQTQVKQLFAGFGDKVRFAGALAGEDVHKCYTASDIYAWPALNEAYGMALLEAQAAGLPVVAGGEAGVHDVVRDGQTGRLTKVGDCADFAEALDELLENRAHRQQLSKNAATFVRGERTLAQAAAKLKTMIDELTT